MLLGLIGMPLTGKSTLFRLLTGTAATGRERTAVGVAPVPDDRLGQLSGLFHPKKTTPATLQLTDTPGLLPGESDRTRLNEFFEVVRKSDALIVVVRAFQDPTVPLAREGATPLRDLRDLEDDLLLADLDRVETVAARLAKNHQRSAEETRTLELLERCRATLEEERPIRSLGLSEAELALLRGYSLLTAKPLMVAVNLDEAQLRGEAFAEMDAFQAHCGEQAIEVVPFCGAVELEIAELDPEERDAFMAEYGLSEPGVARVARAAYGALGLISFLTAGEDEVRAWPIRAGTAAKEAAGKIHSDIERGFIRAEVVACPELVACGSWKQARDTGQLRLEGKEYVVRDGDVINFRFNV